MPVNLDRPRPIDVAAKEITKVLGMAVSLLTALGAVATALAAANGVDPLIVGPLASLPGWFGIASLVLYRASIVKQTEPLVTPLEDPAVQTASGRLVALVPVARDLS